MNDPAVIELAPVMLTVVVAVLVMLADRVVSLSPACMPVISTKSPILNGAAFPEKLNVRCWLPKISDVIDAEVGDTLVWLINSA